MPNRRRFLFASLAVATACYLSPAPATAMPGGASSFIEQLGNEALDLLQRHELTIADRQARVRELLRHGFAIEPIARFVAGRYWRQMTAQQQAEYVELFEEYIVRSYASKLDLYSGLGFAVEGERPDGENGAIVVTAVKPREGPPAKVQWRMRLAESGWKIVDVVIEGISMALTQQSEYASVIRNHGGAVDGLIQDLRTKVGALD